MEDQAHPLPRPYLNRAETDARLVLLGFQLRDGQLRDTPRQREMFVAIQELIASAIAVWVDLKDDIRDNEEGGENEELLEWTEEYLVG